MSISGYRRSGDALLIAMTIDNVVGDILTTDEAKQELAIVDTGNAALDADTDARIADVIADVREWCENEVHRTLAATSDRTIVMNRWAEEIRFADPPLISVTALKYWDQDGSQVTVSSSEYDVLTPTKGPGRLVFRPTFERPGLFERADAVTVEYQAGYGDTASIPAAAKRAAQLMLSYFWDDDREASVLQKYKEAAENILQGLDWGGYV